MSATSRIDDAWMLAARTATPSALGTVVGIGVDAVDVARFRQVLARRPGFAARFFSDAEQADARRSSDPTESLAARFAAKEAVMKALGTGLGGFALTDVEVRRVADPDATDATDATDPDAADGRDAPTGPPTVVLHGAAAALAARRQADRLHLSLTHTAAVAVAFVVAERSGACSPS